MNSILVTGATGFLGQALVMRLAKDGNRVHALYRSEEKIRGWEHENIHFFKGTLGDFQSIERAIEGCRQVYHLAASVSVWTRDPARIYDENIGGTENVLESAMKQGVDKLVYTSTAGVLGPSDGEMNTEDKQFSGTHFTHYDRSKARSEQKILEYVSRGLQAVIVNPTRIYGPGNLSKGNALTGIIDRYLRGKWKIIPGDGSNIGNYVFIDDVVNCHIQAMDRGRTGERYLAGGSNLSFNEFFKILARISGVEHHLFKMPSGLMMMITGGFLGLAHLTGWEPPITPAYVRRYTHDWAVSCEKAKKELDYRPIHIEEGLKRTVEWIRSREV
jgi:farnesol dehydrogenase